jgi:hypothetical protein
MLLPEMSHLVHQGLHGLHQEDNGEVGGLMAISSVVAFE